MKNIIFTTREDLRKELIAVFDEHLKKVEERKMDKYRSINYVARKTGIAHATAKRYIKDGIIKSNKAGMVRESDITEYLNRK